MAYIYDADLEFLGECTDEQLKNLAEVLIYDKDGEKRITEFITISDEYKTYGERYSRYWKLIAEELQHHKNVNKTELFNDIWILGKAIKDRNQIKISYKRESKIVERIVVPVGLMFSEYYFYLLANITDEDVKETFYDRQRIQKS